ncbi:hypothetical protein A7T52_13480 [Salmonella enterica subsp. diarizonae serovar 60:r:e,n,x,z15]|nr:hypothetical protein SED60170_23723 [Salmonella enterica subsp. diarizonae serovar 60:r:e,n,x,z15 str. 01-0170]OHF52204.1 hypothetical protein A7S32_03840 [Salmonella enterica subsp. diarizonae serovar 59:[k]:z35]OHF63722.1 hypothetical protein A7S96_15520 [Salmonella enterica subsp. diarizonae serovar 60:r:e,n,x,z15]OHH12057.1 hypothetical protein A7R90_12755 [Salmonella enterica]OHF66199.1 hypothetical protein A7T04_15500 [Salmonella enterica subsp. diarizonae serovar 60:r:e,n,x,z15]
MHAATTQKNTVYMNALFIGRNRLFISIFSALRFSITSFLPPDLNKKNSKPTHKFDNRMAAFQYIAVFSRKM